MKKTKQKKYINGINSLARNRFFFLENLAIFSDYKKSFDVVKIQKIFKFKCLFSS